MKEAQETEQDIIEMIDAEVMTQTAKVWKAGGEYMYTVWSGRWI